MAGGADTAILQRYQRGYNPKSRANLLPDFKPGTRNTKGKRPTLKTKIRRFLEEDIGTYLFDGSPINREDRLLLQAIEDAENCTEPIDRHRALNIVLDRLYGKPPQTTNTKLSGSLDHNLTGKRWDELSEEECDTIIAEPNRYIERDGRIFEAEFRDVSEGTSAEGEDTEGSDSSVKAAAGAAD